MDFKIIKIYTMKHTGNIVIVYRQNGIKQKKIIRDFNPYYWQKIDDTYEKVFYDYRNRYNIRNRITDDIKECDLQPHQLYLVDKEPKFEDNYKILYYDIETKDTEGGIEIGRDRILSICCIDNNGKEYVFCDDNEKKLLTEFRNILDDYDILIGWNSEKFDLPYIKSRFLLYGIYFEFEDLNNIDLMKIFMKSYLVKKKLSSEYVESYSLSNMSQLFLGDDKLKDESGEGYGGRLWKLFNENREMLIKYNLQDSKLLKRLDEKLHLIKSNIELSQLTGVNIQDTLYQSIMVDIYTLRKAKNINYKFPSRQFGVEKAQYEGGICAIKKAGFYKNVVIFDFKSLYPSLIRTFNISPETMLDDDYNGDCYKTFNDVKFKKSRGIVPKIIDELIEYRFKLRDEQKRYSKKSLDYLNAEIRQIAIKILALSYYGVLGSAFSRYFSLKLATSITVNGQNLMKKLIEFIDNLDYANWIYSDTDSCFISFNNLDDIDKLKNDLKIYIDKLVLEYTGEENKYLDFELEKIFDKFIILSKKKYIGNVINEDGINLEKSKHWIYTKGTELVKGDQIILAKKLFKEVCNNILLENSTIESICNIIDKYKNKILNSEVENKDLMCSLKVSKMPDEYSTLPAHVKLAWDRKKLGERFYVNMKVNFIIIKHSPLTIIDYRDFSGDFDKEHYWNVKIFNPTLRLLEVVYPDFNWQQYGNISLELVGQKTLEMWT